MTQQNTLRDWATQVKIVNKAFAHREAELRAELAQQSLGATQALDAAAAKLAEIESELLTSQAQLVQQQQSAEEHEVQLHGKAAAIGDEAARAMAEQTSISEALKQELAHQVAAQQATAAELAAQADVGRGLQAALSTAQTQHDLATAQGAERAQVLRNDQADLALTLSAAEERAAQLEVGCRSLTKQIAAAAERERLVLQALAAAQEALVGSEAQASSHEALQMAKLQALDVQAERARAAHAKSLQQAYDASRAAQERHERELAGLQAAARDQQAQANRAAEEREAALVHKREAALAQLASMEETGRLLQAESAARERALAAQVVQTLEQASAIAQERREHLAAGDVEHARHVGTLQGELQALGAQLREQVDALQAQLVSAHESKASAEHEAAARERSLRDDLRTRLEASLAQAESNRIALQQETRIYLAQLAERDGQHAAERKNADARAKAAAEALAELQQRCDWAHAELAAARQQHLRMQSQAEQREQTLRSEHGQHQAAARYEMDTAQAVWAVQQANQLRQIQGLTVALDSAHDDPAAERPQVAGCALRRRLAARAHAQQQKQRRAQRDALQKAAGRRGGSHAGA